MNKRAFLVFVLLLLMCCISSAQMTPWFYWTLLPEEQMDYIVREASGEEAWHTIMETAGYVRDRKSDEYSGTFVESQYIYDQLKHYGLSGAEIVRFPGGSTWDGVKGELWEISPNRKKLASYRDLAAMLASGSTDTDVEAELVWVGGGSKEEIAKADVAGKIVVTEGNRERIQNRSAEERIPYRIVAPSGADEPFYYSIETHYGASDHEVFNDWGVGVPGVMMIAWPDKWYHLSGDNADKADPTQLKRTVIIGAAAAYTIANADDNMAIKIAGETTSNGARRLGHKLVIGLEILNKTHAETLAQSYKQARLQVEMAMNNEKETLDSILELATNKTAVGQYIDQMQKTIDTIGKSHLSALQTHMNAMANRFGIKPVKILLSELEARAARIIPKPLGLIKENGYWAYRDLIDQVPEEQTAKYPYGRDGIASTSELQCLIIGKRSAMEIKNMLDAQYERKSNLESVMNYLQVLKLAGLISF